MAGRRLYRSPDGQLGGVCAGVAEYLDLDPTVVRIGVIVGSVATSLPLLPAYVLMWAFVPQRSEALDPADEVDVQWDADRLRVTYPAPIAPHTVPWPNWLGAGVAGVAGLSLLLGVVGLVLTLVGVDVAVLIQGWVAMIGQGLVSLGALWMASGLLPRPYTVSVTHASVLIERPLGRSESLDLAAVRDVHVGAKTLILGLREGDRVEVPLPRDPIAVDALVQQITKARQRALDHHDDLDAADDRRRELERVLASREVPER